MFIFKRRFLILPIVLIFLLIFCSCALSGIKIRRLSRQGKCEAADHEFQKFVGQKKIKENMGAAGGKVVAFTATGTVAVTETLLYLGSGILIGALVCAPLAAIEKAAKTSGRATARCFIRSFTYVTGLVAQTGKYSMTRSVWNKLQKQRSVSYDEITAVLRDNALCYYRRGDEKSIKIARKQIGEIKKEKGLWKYLSPDEQRRVIAAEQEINSSR